MLTRQAGPACNRPACDSIHALLCRSAAHVPFLSSGITNLPPRSPRPFVAALANEHLGLALSPLHRFLLPWP